MPDDTGPPDDLDPIKRLTRDLRYASIALGDEEARFLVDTYYIVQEDRKRSSSQKRELEKDEEPSEVISWFAKYNATLEDEIKAALDSYTQKHLMGPWMRNIYGIGPVLTAGLLAHIDITQAPTVGHIWQYAGYAGAPADVSTLRAVYHVTYPEPIDPNNAPKLALEQPRGRARVELEAMGRTELEATYLYPDGEHTLIYQVIVPGSWKKPPNPIGLQPVVKKNSSSSLWSGEGIEVEAMLKVISGQKPWEKDTIFNKRPHNAKFKTLCWKVGQSFMKFSNRKECFYGHLYRERKLYEIGRNEAMELADQAAVKLKQLKSKDTDAYEWYSKGMLPPAHIDARARRYAVKIFLSHLHATWYLKHFNKEPPKPFAISILGHAHMIDPPDDDTDEE